MAAAGDNDYSSSYESYASPAQEHFAVPTHLKCNQVLAAYNAKVPPVFKRNVKDDFYTRGVVKRSKINQIKTLTQRPNKSVPPNALNTWKDLTPDVKLPDIRHRTLGDIYYTRGKLGEKLHMTKPEFDLSDPVNKRKVLETHKYSSLHDPHCMSYFNKPSVLKHLRKQQLINEDGEVLCDVHEFNKYRSYLGELFNDQVKKRINDSNAMEDVERSLTKAVNANLHKARRDTHRATHEKYRQMNAAYNEAIKRRQIARTELWKRRLHQIDRYRFQVRLANTGTYTVKHWNAYQTRQKAAENEEKKKQHTLIRIAYAETKNDYVCKYDKFVRLALLERYKADQAAVMVARDDQIDDMEELVAETLKRSRQTWLKKYRSYISHCRQNPLSHYQRLLEIEERREFLMRKYFYKWIDYVITQRELKPNLEHQSLFQVDKKLKPFVDTLKTFTPSDFQLDDEKPCALGDLECKIKRQTKLIKLANLGRSFPKNQNTEDDANSKMVSSTQGATHVKFQTGQKNQKGGSSKSKSKKGKKTILKKEVDGNEADVEEADDYIDKLVARYQIAHEELKKKLETVPSSKMPMVRSRSRIEVSKNMSSQPDSGLDTNQEVQKGTITFLKNTTDIVSSQEMAKGRKVLKH